MRKSAKIRRNRLPKGITYPFGSDCCICGGRTRDEKLMQHVVTKRNEHIWFHNSCFMREYGLK